MIEIHDPFWALLCAVPEALLVLDNHGTIQLANQPAAKLFGVSSHTLRGSFPGQHFFTQNPVWSVAEINALFVSREPTMRGVELFVQHHDGSTFPVEISCNKASVGGEDFVLVVLKNILSHKRLEAELRLVLLQLDCLPVSSALLDSQGKIIRVNEGWRQFAQENGANATTEQGVGQDYLEICQRANDLVAAAVADGIKALLEGTQLEFEVVYQCHSPSQLRWIRLQGKRPANLCMVVLSHTDATEHWMAEARLKIQATVSTVLAERKPLLESCQDILHTTCTQLAWDFGAIWLPTLGHVLSCAGIWTAPGDPLCAFKAATVTRTFVQGEGLPGRVWETKKPEWLSAVASKPHFFRAPAAREVNLCSGFAFPLECDGEVLAVIEFFSHIERKPEPELLQLLQAVGIQLATSLFKIRAEQQAEIAHNKAQATQTQLNAILACVSSFVLSVGLDGMIQFINRTGSQVGEVLGTSMFSFLSPKDQERVALLFQEVIATRVSHSYEVSVPNLGGRDVQYACVMSPMLRGEMVTGVVIVAQDITEKKQMEAQLIASERMASMGLLAAGVAHEINNPLTAVAANLELSCLALAAPSAIERDELSLWLGEAKDAVGRVRSIVRDLRLFSRAENEERGPVALWPVMESVLRMAQNEIRHRARLEIQYEFAPLVDANESRLAQVLLNLLMNAAQAIPEGHADLNEIRVTLTTDKSGDVLLTISDTGCGMSAEVQRQIFTPFFSTKPAGMGTGLGLSICARIINGFKGRIEVESVLGKGTTFRVYLPPATREKPRSKELAMLPVAPKRRGRILVIDDEPVIGSIIRRVLIRDHEVMVLNNAKEAIRLIMGGECFDMILCDVMMAEMTGVEFSQELKRLAPGQASCIVFMTGGVFTPKTHEFLTQTKNPQLEKPFDLLTIHNLVNQFVH